LSFFASFSVFRGYTSPPRWLRIAAGALVAQPELSEGLFVGSPRFIEAMVERFGSQLRSVRTRLTPIAPGVISLGESGDTILRFALSSCGAIV
jgi:hypothetical protein